MKNYCSQQHTRLVVPFPLWTVPKCSWTKYFYIYIYMYMRSKNIPVISSIFTCYKNFSFSTEDKLDKRIVVLQIILNCQDFVYILDSSILWRVSKVSKRYACTNNKLHIIQRFQDHSYGMFQLKLWNQALAVKCAECHKYYGMVLDRKGFWHVFRVL